MDLRHYYHRVREAAKNLTDEFYVVVSKDTPDGGKAGVMTEVPRHQAAKLLVEERARLATNEEKELFHLDNAEQREVAKTLAEAGQFQLVAIAEKFIRAAGPGVKHGAGKQKE